MGILANENSIGAGGYQISNSLRVLGTDASAYMTRTPASAGNRRTWTYSAWIKRGKLTPASGGQSLFYAGNSTTTPRGGIVIGNAGDDKISVAGMLFNSATSVLSLTTTAQYRDPSAWYHIVVTLDTTQATASDRCKIYINGSQVTVFDTATYPSQNQELQYNDAILHATRHPSGNYHYDGYMAEVNFIDGQALTPSSFGETDALTGVWVAKRYTGTYGTNGFYLKFNDGTSTTTLGQDRSGNANNWTLTNFTRSAGVSDCWMYDVPSGNGSPSATQPSSNYAVMNPLVASTGATISNANLNVVGTTTAFANPRASFTLDSGKYYWEIALTGSAPLNMAIGLCTATAVTSSSNIRQTGYYAVSNIGSGDVSTATNGGVYVNISSTNWATNDVLMVAYDATNGYIWFGRNGTWYPPTNGGSAGNPASGTNITITAVSGLIPCTHNYSTTSNMAVNFGQRPFAYTPPSGFRALCTANLPAPTIAKGNQYMDATLYSGTGGSQSITNAGSFSPDLVWTKARSQADQNNLMDTVRGVANRLFSNLTNAETTGGLVSVNSNGFSIDATSASMNNSGQTYVAWQWDAGSSTVTNTSGTISSQVRANTTAGVSVVTWTNPASGAFTIGHGLGVAPKFWIIKERNGNAPWYVGSSVFGSPTTNYVVLNTTAAAAGLSGMWPTLNSTQLGMTVGVSVNANTTMVAYCFAEISGFSKVFSYAGNGSTDGTFVYTGFRPKFIMIKEASGTNAASASWQILDTSRNPSNVSNTMLYPNLSGAEGTGDNVDILSNGFKLRASGYFVNESGGTYIGIAFAENPFNYSNAR